MQILLIIIIIILLSLAIAGLSFAPWVPTWKKDLPRVFELAELKPGEKFYELGCGTGRAIFMAAKDYKAKAVGFEIGLPLFFWCKIKQLFYRNKNIKIKYKNFFKQNLSDADVVYFFGMPKALKDKLRLKLEKELKPGTRIISYVFPIPAWQPIKISKPNKNKIAIYLYQQ